MEDWAALSLLLCGAMLLCQPACCQHHLHHTTNQPPVNHAQLQSNHTTNQPPVNHTQPSQLQSNHTTNQPPVNHTQLQSNHTTDQPPVNHTQPSQLQSNHNSLIPSAGSTLQSSVSDVTTQNLNQLDQVQTSPPLLVSQSQDDQTSQSSDSSPYVSQPTPPRDLLWLSDCRTLTLDVNLSFHNLTHLPASLFNPTCAQFVRHLDLSGNQLTTLDPDLLTMLSSLSVLNVSNNKLTQLPGQALRNLMYVWKIDFSHNRLLSLPPGSLPLSLNYLDLSFNRLTLLDEGLFEGLHYLRNLNVSHNQLQDIHPQAFGVQMPSLLWANFSHNQLTAFDGWPYIFNPLINADFRHNSISRFTNRMNITVLTECTGVVDLRYNNLTYLNQRDLAIYLNGTPVTPMKIAFYFSVKIQHNPFVCDCHLHWVVKILTGHLLAFSDDFSNFLSCVNPPFLRGRNLGFLMQHRYLLVCEVTEGCPHGCRCMDTPHHGHVLVSCDPQKHNYTALPARLPAKGLVYLRLSKHGLSHLQAGQCDISRLKMLDVSYNQVSQVSTSFLKKATHLQELNLRHNQLTSLPLDLQRLSVEKLHVAGNPLVCSCPLARFSQWASSVARNTSQSPLRAATSNQSDVHATWQGVEVGPELLDFLSSEAGSSKQSRDDFTLGGSVAMATTPDLMTINCSTQDGRQVSLMDTPEWGLDCETLYINVHALVWSAVSVLLLIVGMVVSWRWRHSLRVLFNYVRFRPPPLLPTQQEAGDERTTTPNMTSALNHVYVSVDEQDDVSITWVMQTLLPILESKGHNSLRVYLPLRQEMAGVCKLESRADAISSCLKFLLVLTPGYSASGLCRWELDFACCHHQQLCDKNVVIVLQDDRPQHPPPTPHGPEPVGVSPHHDVSSHHSDGGDHSAENSHSNTKRLRCLVDKAQNTVQEADVVVEVVNPLVQGAEVVGDTQDMAQHPQTSQDVCRHGEEDGQVAVRNGHLVSADTTLHTKVLHAGTHLPPLQRPTTYIPMHEITRNNHTAADPCSLQGRGRLELNPPVAVAEARVDGMTEEKNTVTSRKHQWLKKAERDDTHQLLPSCQHQTTHRDMPGQRGKAQSAQLQRKPESREIQGKADGEELQENGYPQEPLGEKHRHDRQRDGHRQQLQRNGQRQEGQRTSQRQEGQRTSQRQEGQRASQRPQHQRKGFRRQQERDSQRDMLEEWSHFWELGQQVAVEPLRSFLMQGRYLAVSERLFKHKLLFALSRK